VLARLGLYIIVQVVFVFAALWLLIFVPSERSSLDEDFVHGIKELRGLSEDLAAAIDPKRIDDVSGMVDDASHFRVTELLNRSGGVSRAAIYIEGPYTPQLICGYLNDSTEHAECTDEQVDDASLTTITYALGLPPGTYIPGMTNSRQLIRYCSLQLSDGTPAVLVTAADTNYFITSRTKIEYGLLVLFLFSVLLSQLTVYLITRHVRAPLERLQRGLQQTTEGDVFYQIETGSDPALMEMAQSFNQISAKLWSDQKDAKRFNSLLQDAYLSNVESQAFLSTLIDCSPCCIIATTVQGEMVIFNNKAAEVFGCQPGQLPIGRPISELFTTPTDRTEVDQLHSESPDGFEVICKRIDGEHFPAFLSAAPIMTGAGEMAARLYTFLDISESANFQEMMVQVDRYATRGEMAGDIAHEINNYLAVLSGNLELMPLFLKRGQHEKIATKLEVMKTNVDRIARFADGLMDVNHGEARYDLIDVNQLIQNLISFLKPQNRFEGAEIHTDLDSDLPFAEADAGQVQQLMVNLIHNAADAIVDDPEKSIRVVTRGTTNEAGEPIVRIEVHDSGLGVPADRRADLFHQRFTTKPKGHGYGLVTCGRIVEAHNGLIGFEMQPDSTFYCELPLKHATDEDEATLVEQSAPATQA
jgi:PAS domain S-box-containing protein